MRKTFYLRVLPILLLLVAFWTAGFGTTVLYTYMQDTASKYDSKGKSVSDFCRDVLQALNNELKSQNIRIELKSQTPKSITEIKNALVSKGTDRIDVFLGLGYLPEDERILNYIKIPLYGSRGIFVIRAGLKEKIFEKNIVKVGSIAGTAPAQYVPNIARRQEVVLYRNVNELLEALDKGQIDAAFALGLKLGCVLNGSKGKYQALDIVSEKFYNYIVFPKDVSSQIVLKVEIALRNVRKKNVIENLIKKYDFERYVIPGNVVEILLVDWKPYEWYDQTKKEWVGFDVDVVRKVLENMGFKASFVTFPWARCLEYMKIRAYDATMSVVFTNERSEFLIYTEEPLSSGNAALFKLKSTRLDLSRLENIPPSTRCGYCEGYGYPQWFFDAKFQKIPVTTDEVGFKLLRDKKIDIFITNIFVGKFLAKEMNLDVEWSPTFSPPQMYYLAFAKTYHGELLAKDFSRELKRFKTTPEYAKILVKYGLSYDELWK